MRARRATLQAAPAAAPDPLLALLDEISWIAELLAQDHAGEARCALDSLVETVRAAPDLDPAARATARAALGRALAPALDGGRPDAAPLSALARELWRRARA